MEFKLLPNRKVVPFRFIYHHDKFRIFLESGRLGFQFLEFDSLEII
jgi:hypothetical protein